MSQVSVAEIRWALQTVIKGHSKNLNNNIIEQFKIMFPDSQIAKMYIIIHGIAPYFYEILKASVNLEDSFLCY